MSVTAVPEIGSLLPVAVETLCWSDRLTFDLFLCRGKGQTPLLYREKNFPMAANDVAALREREIRTLLIRNDDLPAYERYLRENVLESVSVPADIRLAAVRDANRSVFMHALQDKQVGKVVQSATTIGKQLVDVVLSEQTTAQSLLKVLSHDYYTYTHVTNVAVYSLVLAEALGIRSQKELSAIAVGALLHDVGKRMIPSTVLNKAGPLTPEERTIINAHPTSGFRELCRLEHLSREQLMMVYQHHERLDGKGYPCGIVEDEILPWSRICTLADVYDAITSHRAYHRPMSVADAAAYLVRHSNTTFDRDMVACWIRKVMSQH